MFTVAWWYMLATYALLWAGVLADPVWAAAAIASCLAQAVVFGIEDGDFFSLTSQVRYVLSLIILAGFWQPWLWWLPLAGLTVRLTTNYCLLARLVSLLPWNRKEPLSAALIKARIFSRPTKGRIA